MPVDYLEGITLTISAHPDRNLLYLIFHVCLRLGLRVFIVVKEKIESYRDLSAICLHVIFRASNTLKDSCDSEKHESIAVNKINVLMGRFVQNSPSN